MFIGSISGRNHNAENPICVFATERSDRLSQRRNKFLWWVENTILFFSQQTEALEVGLTYCSCLLITETYILRNRKRNRASVGIIWNKKFEERCLNISAVEGKVMSCKGREELE